MAKIIRVNKNSLSYFILLALEKSIDGVVYFNEFVNNPGYWAYGTGKHIDKSQFAQAIKRLREKGLIIKDVENDDQIILKLTEHGRQLVEGEKDEEWDGKWRIVIFDIPEQKRVIRNLFRRRLKEWGFRKWQQSVWISKRNVTKKLRLLIDDLKIEDWIAVIESDDTTIGNKILNGRPM